MNFLIRTLGCRVNQAESWEIAEGLRKKGWEEAKPPNLVILNTCCVTNKAEKETRQTARALRRKYPQSFLIVTGCAVDYWQRQGKLPHLEAGLYLENTKKRKILSNLRGWNIPPPRVFLKIQDGCNRFCAYCIVPYLRGRSRSKKSEAIIRDIKQLEEKGVKEVILCGINLSDYKPSLVSLLKKILKETKIPRIRLGSINLEAFSDDLIALWQNYRLCPHFHIPLQSGCDRTLRRMGRGSTISNIKNQIAEIKKRIPNMNITTDVMVGFTGETEEEFKESFKNLQSLKLGKIHVFRYSKREGTRTAAMKNQVSEKAKKARSKKMRELSQRKKEEFVKQFLGKSLRVLFEKEESCWSEGLSENYLKVRTKGRGLKRKIKNVRIETLKQGVLYGRIES